MEHNKWNQIDNLEQIMYDMFYYESVWYVCKNLNVKYCQQTFLT